MRTCDALGADLILIGYTPKPVGATRAMVKKTSIGAEETVAWEHFEHPQQVLDKYYHKIHLGIEISPTSRDLFEYLAKPLVFQSEDVYLWFGNEISGLNPTILSRLTAELHLPMNGQKESLNVSSAVCAAGYLFLQKFSMAKL
jgi:tRNA G18 (ribose-2'-O)-methylase SpoU